MTKTKAFFLTSTAAVASMFLASCVSRVTETTKDYVGTQTYIVWNQGSNHEFRRTVESMADIGMKYMRIDFSWPDVIRDDAVFPRTIADYKARLKILKTSGMRAIFVATTTHDQRPGKLGFPETPEDQNAYANFIVNGLLALGDDAQGVRVEIGSEVNLLTKDPQKIAVYVRLVNLVKQKMLAAGLKNKLIGPGATTWQDGNPDHIDALTFINGCIDQDAQLDGYTIHLYNGTGQPKDLVGKLQQVIVWAKGLKNAPEVDVTETGYSSAPGLSYAVSKDGQAQRDVAAIRLYHATGANIIIVYSARDAKDWCIDPTTGQNYDRCSDPALVEQYYGLTDKDRHLKPSGIAVRDFLHTP